MELASLTLDVVCNDYLEPFPALEETVWFTYYPGDLVYKRVSDAACCREPPPFHILALYPFAAFSTSFQIEDHPRLLAREFPNNTVWNFLEWEVVSHTCFEEAIGYTMNPDPYHNHDLTNENDPIHGGVCHFNSQLQDFVNNNRSLVLGLDGVGTYMITYTAWDGCNVDTGVIDVIVNCSATPTAVAHVEGVDKDGVIYSQGIEFPQILLNGSLSYDERDEPGFYPLHYIWRIIEVPEYSNRLGYEYLSHPNATTNPLFRVQSDLDTITESVKSSGMSNATNIYPWTGTRGTGPVPYGDMNPHIRRGVTNPEAYSMFTPDVFGRYVIRLTVHDGCSEHSTDVEVVVECEQAPTNLTLPGPRHVNVDGVQGVAPMVHV